jgi:hypothetical protein
VLAATLFAAATVVCGYGAVARLLGRERFQRVVTVAQITSTLFIVAGFQILPRMLGQLQLGSLAHAPGWIWLAPPTWFAALDSVLGTREAFGSLLWPAAFGLVLTVVLAWLGVLRLPTTSNSVANLQEEPRRAIEPAPVRPADAREVRAPGRASGLLDLWMRDPVERASFRLAAAYILRETRDQGALGGGAGLLPRVPLITLVNPQKHSDFMPLMILWMTTLVPFTVLEALRVSSHPAAADVFAVTPIRDPSRIFHGVRKASIVFVQLPLLVYVALVGAWVHAPEPRAAAAGPAGADRHAADLAPAGPDRRLPAALAGAAHGPAHGAGAVHVPRHGSGRSAGSLVLRRLEDGLVLAHPGGRRPSPWSACTLRCAPGSAAARAAATWPRGRPPRAKPRRARNAASAGPRAPPPRPGSARGSSPTSRPTTRRRRTSATSRRSFWPARSSRRRSPARRCDPSGRSSIMRGMACGSPIWASASPASRAACCSSAVPRSM